MRIKTKLDPKEKQVYPRIHGLVLDPKDGTLRRIGHEARNDEIRNIAHIYDLFSVNDLTD